MAHAALAARNLSVKHLRSYDRPDVGESYIAKYTKIIGTPPPDEIAYRVRQIERGSYYGVNTPNFYIRKKNGDFLPLLPYMRFDFKETRAPGTYGGIRRIPKTGTATHSFQFDSNRTYACNGIATNSDVANNVAMTLVGQTNIIALQQSAFASLLPELDVLTSMVEIESTIDMILKARSDAKRLILQALRGGKHTVRAALDAWLAWRYGWNTLMLDINAAAEAFNTPMRSKLLTARSGTSIDDVKTNIVHQEGNFAQFDVFTTVRTDVSVRVNVAAEYEAKSLNALASIPMTMWETIPFSFVADWFVSAGDAIGAWQALVGAKSYASSLGIKMTQTASASVNNASPGRDPYVTSAWATGKSVASNTFKLRAPMGNPSYIPQLRIELNSKRILDAVALLKKRII